MFTPLTQMAYNIAAALVFIGCATAVQIVVPGYLSKLGLSGLSPVSIGKAIKWSLISLAAFLIAGVFVAHMKSPTLSSEYKDTFSVDGVYLDNGGGQRVRLISNNDDALQERIRLIANAKESITMSTYDIRDDESGRAIAAMLMEAADRGVEVRLLLDGLGAMTNTENKPIFNTLAAHENVDFRVYSPLSILKPGQLTVRMHEKYLIADNDIMIIGGRNTHDYFLGNNENIKPSVDLDVLIYAPNGSKTIDDELNYFTELFEDSVCKRHIQYKEGDYRIDLAKDELTERAYSLRFDYPEAFSEYSYLENTVEANRIGLVRNPTNLGSKEPQVWHALVELMKNAEKSVHIHTPYLICNKTMYDGLDEIIEANVDLNLTLNSPSTSANPFGAGVYLNEKRTLKKSGMEVMEYNGVNSLHSKAILIDDDIAIVGSFNMDMRSTYIDTEQMLVVDSPMLAAQLSEYMDRIGAQSFDAFNAPEGCYGLSLYTLSRKISLSIIRFFERPLRFLL